MSIRRTINEAVRTGAKWLDKKVPNWEKRVDLQTLDLQDCRICVLGQVYRERALRQAKETGYSMSGYDVGRNILSTEGQYDTEPYGFSISSNDDPGMKMLTRAWERFILGRKHRRMEQTN